MAITEADIDNYSGMYLRKAAAVRKPHTACRSVAARRPRGNDRFKLCGGDNDAVPKPVARADDWRRAGEADRVEHRAESESAVEDCGYIVDQGGQVGVGLVERRGGADA